MKKTISLLLFIIAVLFIGTSFFWLYESKIFVGRASNIQSIFSLENSYLFVSPLRARANNEEKIRITIFVLNNQGLGVAGKQLTIAPNSDLSIETIRGLTDSYGKGVFDVKSAKAGEYYLDIAVEGRTLLQKAHLSFY